jgi:DNA mismatch repair ATPase MutS
VKDYRISFEESLEMNSVEERILDLVARLNPEPFQGLERFCAAQRSFLDASVARFDREVQFYVSYLRHIEPLKRAGLAFCYPRVSRDSKNVRVREAFDLALAHKRIGEKAPIIANDFHMEGEERVFVVTGPNQGGKTTFARMFGQLHHLAALGCPVPGREAQLFLADRVFTHFEREESADSQRGKLQDELERIRRILDAATVDSVIVANELFTSTTLRDAVWLSRKVMARVAGLGALCVWVTFIDELASFSERTVSMVGEVVAVDPARRTFKIVRRPADGLSYALAVAERRGLTRDRLRERLK